jgi:enoyl-CoA hydratase/carnithine racemase
MTETSTTTLVEYSCRDQVATLTLNRPQRLNAFSDDLVSHLADALRRIAEFAHELARLVAALLHIAGVTG